MVEFLQFTLSGISFGMVYAAIALSLVLIWRATRLLNFAQGAMAMFTTYIGIEVIYHTHSYWPDSSSPSPPGWCSAPWLSSPSSGPPWASLNSTP